MMISIVLLIVLGGVAFAAVYSPRFGRTPRGKRMERIKQSPNYYKGEFQNQHETPQLTTEGSRAKMMFDFLFEKRVRNRPDVAMPAVKSDLKSLPSDKDLIVWFGHSSYLLQIAGKRILIDPVFYDASPVSFFNKPFKGTDIYKAEDMPAIDYLIITHDHWDHLDHKAVTRLKDRIGKVICPLGVGEHFEYWGYEANKLVELDWNEQLELTPDFELYCLPARHFSGRTFKANQALWASFLLKTPAQTVYIGGDGGYDTHFKEIAERFPTIDLALMENGQYDKGWRYIHLIPDDLVKAINDLNPRSVIAGHNSKYALAKHPWDEPQKNMVEASAYQNYKLITPTIGEVVFVFSM